MIIQADILSWADTYTGPKIHAVFGDPPYGLNENEIDIVAVLNDWMAGREHRPKGSGFMGREWDSFLPGPAIWAAIRRHCHPGALLFAFGGTRTADLLGVAIRLGGWEKIDEIDSTQWMYAVGFPKNHNVSKAQDARAFHAWLKANPEAQARLRAFQAKERECRRAAKECPGPTADALLQAARVATKQAVVELKAQADLSPTVIEQRKHAPKFDAAGFEYRLKDNGFNSKDRTTFDVTAPASEQGRVWEGYGTALKPAHEPILVFRNPFKGTYAENCEKTGAGALNIAGGRIGTEPWSRSGNGDIPSGRTGIYGRRERIGQAGEGRWPANLILCHTPLCADTCTPDCPVERLGALSGESKSKASQRGAVNIGQFGGYGGDDPNRNGASTERGHNDSGTAARFFFQADWQLDRLEAVDPIAYFAKPSRGEREAGLDPMQIRLLREQFEDDEFEEIEGVEAERADPGALRDSGRGPHYDGRFPESTVDDGRDNPYQRGETKRRNLHPCLKPLRLTRYLATVLLPPAAYAPRRILIPFCGSGSEYLGALLAGWEEVIGVEMMPEYCRIAQARIAYWQQMRHRLHNDAPIRVKIKDQLPDGQLSLF